MKIIQRAILFALMLALGTSAAPGFAQTNQNGPDKPASGSTARTELETYEGRLEPGDVSFKLHIFEAGRATAEWERKIGASTRYEGTYSGTDGNYTVKLDPVARDQEKGAPGLNLTLRSTGGMVKGSYSAGTGTPRDVADLKLTGVSTPNSRLGGAKKGGQSANRSQRNSNANRAASQQRRAYNNAVKRANRIRNRNRRTIVIPGVNPTYQP